MRARIVATLGVLSLAALLTQIVAAPSFAASQSTQTEQVMHQKLEHSGQLLAALVTGDWARLERHGQALQEVTTQPGWDVLIIARPGIVEADQEALVGALGRVLRSGGVLGGRSES